MSTDPALRAHELRKRVIREITVAPGWNLEDATALVDELILSLPYIDERAALAAPAEAAPHTLFHGHHPMCPYTIEGDWSVCDCGAATSREHQHDFQNVGDEPYKTCTVCFISEAATSREDGNVSGFIPASGEDREDWR